MLAFLLSVPQRLFSIRVRDPGPGLPGWVRRTRVAALVLGCGVLLAAEPALAGESLFVGLAAGYDTNGLRLNTEERGATFSELSLGGGLRYKLGPSLDWFLSGSGQARQYEAALDDADFGRGDLRVGFEIVANRLSRRRLVMAVGGLYGVTRSTFTDRTTGGIYEIESPGDPGNMIPIGNRFDADTAGAFFDLRWTVHRRVRLALNSRYEQASYLTDYSGEIGLDPLDYTGLTLEPGVFVQLHRELAVGLSAVITDLEYSSLPALDDQGYAVTGTRRTYGYTDYRLTLLWTPTKRVSLRAGLRDGVRDDLYAGYYDFASQVGFVGLDYRPGLRTRLQFYASRRELDYDHAEVFTGGSNELRASDVQRHLARFDWQFRQHLNLFVEAGQQQTDGTDAEFVYEREWVMTGVTYRL
jgi:hypothetical protein